MNTTTEVWPNGIPTVGQKAQRSLLVTARDIELFTEINGNKNPLHYDEELAKNTCFGGIVVQGGITSAILNAIVAEDLPGPGNIIIGEVEVTKVRKDKPITELNTRVLLEDGSVVLEGTACYTMPIT